MANENREVARQDDPFQMRPKGGGFVSVEQQRAIAQVQASMIIARNMPRDRQQALDLILQDCTDMDLSEQAEYQYNRGGSDVSGPSIRLLEAVARRWGNLETGIEEISRQDGFSEFRAYAMDLETGWRDQKIFQVKHWRDTKKGGYLLTDERDIYELGANMGARRKRACMEAVIPADIIRQAAKQCQTTLQTKVEITPDLIASTIESFSKFGVTKEMIEKRIQRHITAITPGLVVQLRRIHNSLRDGMAQPADFFEMAEPGAGAEPGAKPRTGAAGLKEALTGADKKDPAKTPGAEDRKPEDLLGGKKGGPELADVTKVIEKALATVYKATALLVLDDAELLTTAFSKEDKSSAAKAIAAARKEIGERVAPKK